MKRAVNSFLHEDGWKRAIPFVLLFTCCIEIYQYVPEMWDFYFGSLCAWGYMDMSTNPYLIIDTSHLSLFTQGSLAILIFHLMYYHSKNSMTCLKTLMFNL